MPGANKRKTTMAKLARERRLHERRIDKQARKEARKRAAEHAPEDGTGVNFDETGDPSVERPDLDAVPHTVPRD